ncbi:hypothetical protein N7493_003167 [Penicillium malachiteum]|uniref:Uncharacterized protein n=1 Tax=Penicillium malachiteum TaxID=1324776 RepID=A0AAD6MZF8_9EURO|nr:hypothetical protein N7493_003167 [Penicillium malachiteum]
MTVSKVNSPSSSPRKESSVASSEHGWQGRFGHLLTDDLFLFQNPENRERPLPPPTLSWRQRTSQELQSKVSSLCAFFRLPPMPGFDLGAFTHGIHRFLQMVFISLVLLVAGRLIWEEALFQQASSFKGGCTAPSCIPGDPAWFYYRSCNVACLLGLIAGLNGKY